MKKDVFNVTEKMMDNSIVTNINDLEFDIITSIINKKNQVFILDSLILVVFFKDGYVWCKGKLNGQKDMDFGLIEENNIQDMSFALTVYVENIISKVKNI